MISMFVKNTTCNIHRTTGENEYGEPERIINTDVGCRFEKVQRYAVDENGHKIVTDGILFLDADAEAKADWMYEINSEFYVPVIIDEPTDLMGTVMHKEIGLRYGKFAR